MAKDADSTQLSDNNRSEARGGESRNPFTTVGWQIGELGERIESLEVQCTALAHVARAMSAYQAKPMSALSDEALCMLMQVKREHHRADRAFEALLEHQARR